MSDAKVHVIDMTKIAGKPKIGIKYDPKTKIATLAFKVNEYFTNKKGTDCVLSEHRLLTTNDEETFISSDGKPLYAGLLITLRKSGKPADRMDF